MILLEVLVLITCFAFGMVQTKDPLFSAEVEKLLAHLESRVRDSKIDHDDEDPIPETFDARENWPHCEIIQWIRNQWDCQCACFVFAVVSMIADRLCIASEGIKQTELSAYDAMACCDECLERRRTYKPCLDIVNFTDPITHFWFNGLASGGDYNTTREMGCAPILHKHIKAEAPSCPTDCLNPSMETVTIESKRIPSSYWDSSVRGLLIRHIEDIITIQRDIMKDGPAAAVLFIDDEFRNYSGGIYKGVTKFNLSDVTAVKIFGWGVENNVPYWLAANTMGTDWGEKGFLKIVRDVRVVRFFAVWGIDYYEHFGRTRPTKKTNASFDSDKRRKNDSNDTDEEEKDNKNKNDSSHSQALENYTILIAVTFVLLFLLG